jgi:hypothetical protein
MRAQALVQKEGRLNLRLADLACEMATRVQHVEIQGLSRQHGHTIQTKGIGVLAVA